jgi:hypothetical protein
MSRACLGAAAVLLAAAGAFTAAHAESALPDSAASGSGSITIQTGADTAIVFIDSVRAGTTPLTVDSLRGGKHILRLYQRDLDSWLTGRINDTVYLSPGEKRTLSYAFDRRVIVITDPSGAIVYMGDSAAGTTPCVISSGPGGLPRNVTVVRKGYEKTILSLPKGDPGIARIELQKTWQSEQSESPLMTESGSSEHRGLRLYVAGGVAVAAGVAAAYFKIKADGKNALFQQSGDLSLQRETTRLDTSAAISLIITEVGFGLFSYYLLSD